MENGTFVISLDFELYWGVRDVVSLEHYKENLKGVRLVIPALVDIFNKYKIYATFATVGFLFFKNKKELLNSVPLLCPTYENENLSPYISHVHSIGENESSDIYHYAWSLIDLLEKNHQEISTHTFSHYYCLEKGQTANQFKNDIIAAKQIGIERGIQLESIIFPRHQFNDEHLKICYAQGIKTYRGNQKSFVHTPLVGNEKAYFRRLIRIIDSYINLLGHNTYHIDCIPFDSMLNIPASRFLRPYSRKLKFLDKLRLNRILKEMTYAAKEKRVYHLWWHPHNFGLNLEENLSFLDKILQHYNKLHSSFEFESLSMKELHAKLYNNSL